ncbi:MAG: hypothetical protein GVX90_00460 [Alphaproteobacteria bacterium]|jgi:hypothetical protein|nr:hypothetical protein [Alphaproteobacteria bacterium]
MSRTQRDAYESWFHGIVLMYLAALPGLVCGWLGVLGLEAVFFRGLWPLLVLPAPVLMLIAAMRFRARADEMPRIFEAVHGKAPATPEDDIFNNLDFPMHDEDAAPLSREPTLAPAQARQLAFFHIVIAVSSLVVFPMADLSGRVLGLFSSLTGGMLG